MLEFRDIDISDKKWVDSLLAISDFRGCEYSFANNMAWKRLSNSKICRYKNFYICRSDIEQDSFTFTFPAGKGNYKEIIEILKNYSEKNGFPLKLWNVSPDTENFIRNELGFNLKTYKTEDLYDYIYLTDELISLKGRKFHQKRNHLKKSDSYEWEYVPITEKIFDECIVFCTNNYNSKNMNDNHSGIAEQFAINTYFTYFNELGLSGGIIKSDGKIIALSVGERLNSDTFCVHIEKADTSYAGTYPLINNCFTKNEAVTCKYINREEDMGIEGLRKAKRSYNPVFMVEKNTVEFI
jgi:hypothetical protein